MTQTPTKRMSAAMKSQFEPVLKARGFAGSFPRYRRNRPAEVQLLAIFYDKAASRFFLEFGAHERGDKTTSWGEVVPESKLLLEHVHFDRRARLQARCNGGSIAEDWFAFETFSEEGQFHELAESLIQLLPQVEAWFESGAVGPNILPNRL